jgi:uncharacterized repeat protein (TIGR04052 family)
MKVLKKPLRALLLLSWFPLLQACEVPEKQHTVKFSPQVGEQPLSCTSSYTGIGKTATTVELLDFKLYVRDVTLVRANGEKHPLVLEQDGKWQRESIALLDFEDGTGTCDTGSPETHMEVVGTAPDFDDYTGLEFTLGVPEALNHLDGATAAAPLNSPSMWWSWKGGYKFMRLDVRTSKNPTYFFHLGSSRCTGSTAEGYTCAASNQPAVIVSGFDPSRNQVVLDVAGLYANSDLDNVIDQKTDLVAGCMSNPMDPECPSLFSQVGLAEDGTSQAVPASFIRVR